MKTLAVIASLLLASCASLGGDTGGAEPSATGAPATDFALQDIDGRTVHLSDFPGQVVLVDFWATWCVPCQAELPQLERLYETYRGQGFVVLGIAMDGTDTSASVPSFARRYKLAFPVLLDTETRVTAIYNPKRTAPLSVLIGRDGQIVRVRQGFNAGDDRLIESDVKAQLARK